MKDIEISADRFDIIKDQVTRSYENFFLEAPYQHAAYYLSFSLSEMMWKYEDLAKEIVDITMEEVQAFIPIMLSTLHIEGLAHGSLEQDKVISMFDNVQSILAPRPLLPSQFIGERAVKLSTGDHCIYQLPVRDPDDVNSAIGYYTQICPVTDIPLRARLGLVAQIAQEPCFNQLRTKEQLGYLVFSGIRKYLGMLGFRMIIQSERDPVYLENRTNEFLDSLREIIQDMTEKDYQSQVASLIADRLEKHKNLWDEGYSYWSHIESGYYEYDEIEKDVAELGTITKESLLSFYDQYIVPTAKDGSALSIHLKSKKTPVFKSDGEANFTLDELYPVLRYLSIIDRKAVTEENLKDWLTDFGGDTKISTKEGLSDFLEHCKEKDILQKPITPQLLDEVVDKLKQGPTGYSDRDHTKLPENAILVDDLVQFKRSAQLSAAPVPFYTFQYA
jgi:insulysin